MTIWSVKNFTCLPKTQSQVTACICLKPKSLSASIFIKRNQKLLKRSKPVGICSSMTWLLTAIRIAGDTKRRLFSVQRPNGLSTWKAKVCVSKRWPIFQRWYGRQVGDKIVSNRWCMVAQIGVSAANVLGACRLPFLSIKTRAICTQIRLSWWKKSRKWLSKVAWKRGLMPRLKTLSGTMLKNIKNRPIR